MGFQHIDMTAALRRLADRRIEEAMKEGKFDNLAGAGKDLVLDDMPADENARLMWWCLRILRNNDYTPDEVRWRKIIDSLKDRLPLINDEKRLRETVGQINELVQKLNTLGTNALISGVAPVSLEDELDALRVRVARAAHP
jgi:hypothetical protein